MARIKQFVINYHTSGQTNPSASDVKLGELVVMHNNEKPKLIIKKTNGTFAEFIDEKAITGLTDTIQQSLNGFSGEVHTRLVSAEGAISGNTALVESFSGYVVETYATSADTEGAIAAAKKEAIAAASAAAATYADSKLDTVTADIENLKAADSGLTSSLTAFSGAVEKIYATSAATEGAIKAAKEAAIGAASSYTNTVSGHIESAIDTVKSNLESGIEKVASGFSAFSGYVKSTYATSADTHNAIANAKVDAIGAASAYTDTVSGHIRNTINALSGNAYNAITKVNDDLTDALNKVNSALTSFSGHVKSAYATSADTHNAIKAAKAEAVSSAAGYTVAVSADIQSTINALSGNAYNAIADVDDKVNNLTTDLNAVSSTLISTSASVVNYIDDKLSVVYKYKGSVANYEALTGITGMVNGDVYNVVAAHGTKGDSGYTPAGTNFAYVAAKDGVAAHWDALGGVVDLTGYATTGITDALGQRIDNVSSALSAFSGTVVKTYATSAKTHSAIATAKAEAIGKASAYTDTVSGGIVSAMNTLSGDTYKAITGASDALGQRIDNVSSAFSAFSGTVVKTYATSANTHSAIKTAKEAAIGAASAYTDTVSGGIVSAMNTLSGDTYKAITGASDALGQRIDNVSSAFSAFSGTVVKTYATSANTHSAIATAKAEAIGAASAYTDTVSGGIVSAMNTLSGDTYKAITGVSDTLGKRIDNVSSALSATSVVASSAIQSVALGTVSETSAGSGVTIANGAKVKYVAGGAATIDLSKLIIDCGEF